MRMSVETFVNRFRMPRASRVADFDPATLAENFKKGRYTLPRHVRRYLRRPLEAFAHRPRLSQAITTLVWVIGCYHTGSRNFLARGCGIGPEGSGFFLARQGLARSYPDLTEALVREATRFLIEIGFIERITPKGDLVEVRRPKNGKGLFGYFRTGLKATKDALGRIRSPLTMYRLGTRSRQLFAKPLQTQKPKGGPLQEPLWMFPLENYSRQPSLAGEGLHSGSSPISRSRPRFSQAERDAANEQLDMLKRQPKPMKLSAAAMAIFSRS